VALCSGHGVPQDAPVLLAVKAQEVSISSNNVGNQLAMSLDFVNFNRA